MQQYVVLYTFIYGISKNSYCLCLTYFHEFE